jgi:two-component system sensor histidine kinase AlgZ
MESTSAKWGRILAMNAAGGALPAAFFLLVGRPISGHDLLVDVGEGLLFANCIGIPAWLILPRLGVSFFCRRFPWNWASLLLALLVIAAAGCFVADLILVELGMGSGGLWTIYARSLRSSFLVTLVFGVAGGITEKLRMRLERTTLELRTKELAEERARKMATEAQLRSLESRVQPHFLFNTLNSISSLISEDPARAERVVERLAALLRFSLDANRTSVIPLRQELKIVRDYLEIEKARFGARLRYSIDAPDEAGDLEVPPMAVQTLVENSVKHGVAPRREGGEIRIQARLEDQHLVLEVSDDGPGFDEDAMQSGHGLDILQGRLAALFGEPAKLVISRRDRRSVVSVSLPQRAAVARPVGA